MFCEFGGHDNYLKADRGIIIGRRRTIIYGIRIRIKNIKAKFESVEGITKAHARTHLQSGYIAGPAYSFGGVNGLLLHQTDYLTKAT